MITNQSVKDAIADLNALIKKLKEINPNYPFKAALMKFFKHNISRWLEREMTNQTDEQSNEEIMNKILDWMNRINRFIESLQKGTQ